ncbi:MAG: gliding motility-associated C-terminal domain-containing protein [Bacteroidetes bacterium]|nr:gliding motility-associated C-terminal domain-containing protein [Bacteroidota bacterium]
MSGLAGPRLYAQDYRLEVEQVKGGADTLFLDVYIQKASGPDFALGAANFVINIDTSLLDISDKGILVAGPWSGVAPPDSYFPLEIGGTFNFLNLSVVPTNAGPGINVTATRTRVARIFIIQKDCNRASHISWRVNSGVILDYASNDIKPQAVFVPPLPALAGARITNPSGNFAFCADEPVLKLWGNAVGSWSIISPHGTAFDALTGNPLSTDTVYVDLGNALVPANDTLIFSLGSCRDTVVFSVTPVSLVSALPPFDLTTAVAPQPVCAELPVRLVASGPADWQVLNGGAIVSPFTTGTPFIDVVFPNTLAGQLDTIVLTSPFPCGRTDTIFVQVQERPEFVTPALQVCGDSIVQYEVAGSVPPTWTILSGVGGTPSGVTGGNPALITQVTFGLPLSVRVDTLIATSATCADTLLITVYPNNPITGANTACPDGGAVLLNTGIAASNWSISTNLSGASIIGSPGSSAFFIPGMNASGADLVDVVTVDYGGGCLQNFPITVHSLPAFTVTTTDPLTICEDATVTLTASDATYTGYQWLRNNFPIPGETGVSLVTNIQGNYTVIATTANGCSDTAANVLTLTVNPLPVPVASGPQLLVIPALAQPYSVANAAGMDISWTRNGSAAGISNPTAVSPAIDFTSALSDPSLTDTVVVRLTNPVTGCFQDDTLLVFLNLCNAIAGPASADTSVCTGESAVVYVGSFLGDTLYWISGPSVTGPWTHVSTGVGFNSSPVLYTEPLVAPTYYALVVSTAGFTCVDTSDVVFVDVTVAPDRGITSGAGIFCTGTSPVLTYTGTSASLQWQVSPDAITWSDIASETSPIYTIPSLAASAYYRVLITEGCRVDSGDVQFVQHAGLPSGSMPADTVLMCQAGVSAPLGATLVTGTGFWTTSRPGIFLPSLNAPNATFTDMGTGEALVTFYYVITSGTCTPIVLERQVYIYAPSLGTFASTPSDVCAGGSTGHLGATAIRGTGVWTAVPSVGSLGYFTPNNTTPNARYITHPSNSGSTVDLIWTVTNGVCAPAVYQQTLNVLVPVVDGAFPPITPDTVCAEDLVGPLGGVAYVGTGAYSHNGGGSIVQIGPDFYYQSVLADAGLDITLTYTVTQGACTPLVLENMIRVNRQPLGYFVGPLTPICSTSPTPARFFGIRVFGRGHFEVLGPHAGTFFDNPLNDSASYTPVPGVAEQVTIAWIVQNSPCDPDTIIHVLDVGQTPVAGTIDPIADICSGSSTTPFNVVGTVGTGTWSLLPNGSAYTGQGAISDPSDPNAFYTSVLADANQVIVLQWRVCEPGCGCVTTTQSFFVNNSVVDGSFATAPTTICQGGITAPLGAYAGPGNTGVWLANANGAFSDPLDPNATFTPNPGYCGTTVLRWEVTTGGCPPGVFQQNLTVSCRPAGVFAAGPPDVCFLAGSQTDVFSATAAPGTTGHWRSNGTGVFSNPTGTSTRYIPGPGDAASTVELRWITQSTNCPPDTQRQYVNVVQPPVGAFTTNIPPFCAGGYSAQLNAIVLVGTGRWETDNGLGAFVDIHGNPTPNDPNAYYLSDVADAGHFINLYWIVNNGPTCVEDTNLRVVEALNVSLTGSFAAFAPDTICEGDTTVPLNATFAPPSPAVPPAIGTWSSSGTGLFVDAAGNPAPNDPNARYVHLSAVGNGIDSVTLTWTVSRGLCADLNFDRKLYISKTPLGAFSSNPGNICAGDVTIPLIGQAFEGTGYWSCSNCVGSFIPNSNAPNAQYQSLLGDGGNIVTLEWNVVKNACPVVTYTQNVQVFEPSDGVFATVLPTICAGQASIPLGAVANVGVGSWSCNNCHGGFTTPTSDGNSRYISVSSDGGQTVELVWTVQNGTCPPVSYSRFLQVDTLPDGAMNTVISTVCLGDLTIPLSAETYSGGGRWTTTGFGSFVGGINNPNAQYLSVPADETVPVFLCWRVGNGVCDSVDYCRVMPKFPIPHGGFTDAPDTICTNSSTGPLNAFATVGSGRWYTSGGGTFHPNNINANASYQSVAADANQDVVITWRVGTADCPGDSVDYPQTVFVKGLLPAGIVTPASKDITICLGDTVVITAMGGTQYNWVGSDFQFITANSIRAIPLVTRRYDVLIFEPTSNCTFLDTILINVQPGNLMSITPSVVTDICPGDPVTLSLSQFPAGTFTNVAWTPQPFDVTDPVNPVVRPLMTTTYVVTATTANGCRNTTQYTVTVLPTTLPTLNAPDLCGLFDDYFISSPPIPECVNRVWYRTTLANLLATPPALRSQYWIVNPSQFPNADTVTFPVNNYGFHVYVLECFNPNTGCTSLIEDTVWASNPPQSGFYAYPKAREAALGGSDTNPLPPGVAPLPVTSILEPSIQFVSTYTRTPGDSVSIFWYFGDTLNPRNIQTDVLNPQIRYTRPGKYTVIQLVRELQDDGSGQECQDLLILTDYVEIKEEEYFFPTAFTPNGDGVNDRFRPVPVNANPRVEYIRIFDRWGNQVFETDARDGWDGNTDTGKPFDPGTYTYKAKIIRITGEPIFYEGTVTLIR